MAGASPQRRKISFFKQLRYVENKTHQQFSTAAERCLFSVHGLWPCEAGGSAQGAGPNRSLLLPRRVDEPVPAIENDLEHLTSAFLTKGIRSLWLCAVRFSVVPDLAREVSTQQMLDCRSLPSNLKLHRADDETMAQGQWRVY